MSITEKVNIHAMIFHRLSPVADFLLSAQEVPLNGPDDPLCTFFGKHIKNSLNDESARAARFLDPAGQTSTSCSAILQNEAELVSHSRTLAQKLFDIVTAYKGNISEGNLAFCLFSTEWSPLYRLAILKLDPSEVLRPIIETGPQGVYFAFERDLDALPTVSDRLQKCAFVDPPPLQAGFEMLVIDRQSSDLAGPARFFIGDFLEADLNFTDAQRTTSFYRAAREAHETVRPGLTSEENELLTQARVLALSGEHLNVDEWLRQLPLREALKAQFTEKIQAKVLERDFTIDPSTADKRIRSIVYRGDYGLRVEVQAQHASRVIVKQQPREVDGQVVGYTITIETETWKEVSR